MLDTPGPVMSARPLPRRDARGQAMISVILFMSVMLVLVTTAMVETFLSGRSTLNTVSQSTATLAADAGLSVALYDIASGTYKCTLPTTSLPASSGTTSTYSVTATYYSTYADPEPAPTSSNSVTCSGGKVPLDVPFGAVVVTSSGTATDGSSTLTAAVQELVKILPYYKSYDLYFGASSLTLKNVTVTAGASTAVLYAAGNVTYSGTAAGGPGTKTPPTIGNSCLQATLTVQGSLTVKTNVCIKDTVNVNGTLTLSYASIGGSADTWGGTIVMADAFIEGDVAAYGQATSGKVILCPTGTATRAAVTACSSLQTGNTTVGTTGAGAITSTATASNTIRIGNTVLNTPKTVCAKKTGNAEVTGCALANATLGLNRPRTVPLPDDVAPISAAHGGTTAQVAAYASWTAAGYTVDAPATTCTTTNTGSVYKELSAAATASTATVVVAQCAGTLTLSLPSSGGGATYNLSHNLALFSSTGINFKGSKFNGAKAQFAAIVPTPTSSYTCTGSAYGITFSTGSGASIGAGSSFLYTPCGLTVNDNVTLKTAQLVVGGTLTVTSAKKLKIKPDSATVPDFSFGYQELDIARYVTKG